MTIKISDLLGKYLAKQPPSEIMRAALVVVLKDSFKIDLKPESIRIDRGIAYIQAGAAVKNEIFMRRADILAKVREKEPTSKLTDIR